MALYHLVLWQPPLSTARPGYRLMMLMPANVNTPRLHKG